MAHHAFFIAAGAEVGIEAAKQYVQEALGQSVQGNPDVSIETYGLFSVEDARALIRRAGLHAVGGKGKVFVISAQRFFHEAQNTLLKLFEEPPEGTTLILVVPSEGNLIPTLRSRVQVLPKAETRNGKGKRGNAKSEKEEDIEAFIAGGAAARAEVVEKILKRAKSDDEDEKLAARALARRLAEALAQDAYAAWRKKPDEPMRAFLSDLDRIIPVLHDRAAPLKPILEHLLITAPKTLG